MMRVFLMLAAILILSGCASAGDIALRTAENVARSACSAMRGCTNTCPDGSAASPHTHSCAKATKP
jgi:hypothetical protein